MVNKADCVHDCDVLVIGGGLAGCWAALRAKDFTDKVILVEKAKVSKSGASSFNAGIMLAPIAGDDLSVWLKEIVEAGEYISDQDWIEVVLSDQISRLKDFEAWGLPIERDEDGKMVRIAGRGHVNTRVIPFRGPRLMEILREHVQKKKIELVERVMLLDLLTSDGESPTKGSVVGAIGIGTLSGDIHIFRAKAVIIATSSMGGRGTMFTDNLTGDGVAMAFRTGANLHGMEFVGPRTGWVFDRRYKVKGLNMFQHAGAFFVNALEEKFMEKYDPELKDRARTVELTQGLAKEGVEGRGPTYIDMTHIAPEKWEQFKRVIPSTMKMFETLKPWRNKIIFDVGASGTWSNCSGIWNNIYCETNIPGLYVAGQAGGFLAHGTYSVGGLNLAITNVSGYRAGEYAAKYAQLSIAAKPDSGQVDEFRKVAFYPLEVTSGPTAEDIDYKLKEVMHPAANILFRHEKRMHDVVQAIVEIRALLNGVTAANPHELTRCHEMRNFALLSELVFRASLERKESRGFNLREDYPYRDDVNWLKRVILTCLTDGSVGIRLEPIPLYRYPVKPEKLQKIPPKVMPPKSDE
ncbi:FAD-dependent oxidoreductase [Chloroflexota bacterium]